MAKFSNEVVRPRVREMDENELLDKTVLKGLFDQGVCAIDMSFLLTNLSSLWASRLTRSTEVSGDIAFWLRLQSRRWHILHCGYCRR